MQKCTYDGAGQLFDFFTYFTKRCRHFLGRPTSKNMFSQNIYIKLYILQRISGGLLTAEIAQRADESQS